ncbi:hypothetical protein K438DRAFT_1967174 [Mycena galopus ATCC 62051]|nr:hypothetical protein K438DRAFT_1967174 [Mycena galopus ATCC 62051]
MLDTEGLIGMPVAQLEKEKKAQRAPQQRWTRRSLQCRPQGATVHEADLRTKAQLQRMGKEYAKWQDAAGQKIKEDKCYIPYHHGLIRTSSIHFWYTPVYIRSPSDNSRSTPGQLPVYAGLPPAQPQTTSGLRPDDFQLSSVHLRPLPA